MITLVEPCERYLESYIKAYKEYEEKGITTYHLDNAEEYDIFEKYENYRLGRNLKPNRVRADYYWLVNDEKAYFIGEISVRHILTDALKKCGGNIGYGVRCGEWGKGYGTKMLCFALERAKSLGLKRVLVTCDDDNPASARVMEKNGMQLEDKILYEGVLIRRYWKTL